MEDGVGNMIFVRCPKCSKLLPEFSNVPMYQCGGCNAILQAKHYTCNSEKPAIESSDVALEISSVFSFNIKDGNWSYQDDSMASSFENYSQTSADKSYLGCPNRKKRNDSLMQNISPDEENEDSRNSYSAWNQCSKSISQYIDHGVHSSNSSRCASNLTSKTSLDSESFYSVGSRIEDENEERLLDSTSTGLAIGQGEQDDRPGQQTWQQSRLGRQCASISGNSRMELHRTVEKLRNQIEVMFKFKTLEQNRRMYKLLTENENPGSSKGYVLPVSKGAPFVICNYCLEMLHIPLNLRMISKGFNKVKCSSCLEVLRLQFPSRCAEKLRGVDVAEAVDSISMEYEPSASETSGAEIEAELQGTNEAPEVKYTLHQLMGYMSARMLLQ